MLPCGLALPLGGAGCGGRCDLARALGGGEAGRIDGSPVVTSSRPSVWVAALVALTSSAVPTAVYIAGSTLVKGEGEGER
eukprot:scaffold78294_cov48-Phaeocystis_antarctica.AAC.1